MPLAVVSGADDDLAIVLLELGALLVVLGALARLAVYLRTSPVPFYLAVGVLLGVLSAPIEVPPEVIELGAAIGVVLLLFFIGLEYTGAELLQTLREQRRAGALDAALNALPALAIGLLMGLGTTASLALAGIAWVSSSGIVARTLEDLGRLGNRETPGVLSILVIEDLAMAGYLPVLTALLAGGALAATIGSVAVAVSVAAVALLIAVRGSHHADRLLGGVRGEALLLMMLGLTLLVAGIAETANVSSAVGAFLVGIAVSGQLADRTRSALTPLRDLFAAAFFVFFGLQINLAGVASVAIWVVILCILGAAGKIATGWYVAGRSGTGHAARLRAGTVLVARGEFSIIIASLAVAAGVDPRLGPLAAGYVLILALLGSLMTRFADPVSRRIARRALESKAARMTE